MQHARNTVRTTELERKELYTHACTQSVAYEKCLRAVAILQYKLSGWYILLACLDDLVWGWGNLVWPFSLVSQCELAKKYKRMILLKKSSFSELEQCEKKACLNSTYGERGEEKAMKEKHGNHRKRLNPLIVSHLCPSYSPRLIFR